MDTFPRSLRPRAMREWHMIQMFWSILILPDVCFYDRIVVVLVFLPSAHSILTRCCSHPTTTSPYDEVTRSIFRICLHSLDHSIVDLRIERDIACFAHGQRPELMLVFLVTLCELSLKLTIELLSSFRQIEDPFCGRAGIPLSSKRQLILHQCLRLPRDSRG